MHRTNKSLALGIACRALCPVLAATLLLAGSPTAQAQNQFVPGRILVKFKANVPPGSMREQLALTATGTSVVGRMSNIGVTIVRTPPNSDEHVHLAMLRAMGDVDFAELDEIHQPASIPDDPNYPNQWHLPMISAPAAWDVTTGNPAVIIAILDTGVDGTHPDLVPNLVPGWNIYDNNSNTADVTGHGTAVAGVAAAVGNNALGCASPAWNCRIMPVRVSISSNGCSNSSTIANGIIWAGNHGARVVNISYSNITGNNTITAAAQNFQNAGGIVAVAAGNEGTFITLADNPYELTVSATDSADALPTWTNTGNCIDLAAPGLNLYTTTPGGLYGVGSGTSFSAPLVAGVAALMFSANPNLTGAQARDLIKQAADDLGPTGWDPAYGWGRLNAAQAVALAASATPPPPPPPPPGDTTAPTVAITSPANGATIGNSVTIAASASDNVGVVRVQFYVDGVLKATDTAAPFSYKWNSRTATHGPHALLAKAYDAAGNMGLSATITVNH